MRGREWYVGEGGGWGRGRGEGMWRMKGGQEF